jgi:hypothetical protein
MNDEEKKDFIASVNAYISSLKDNPSARRQILISAGIVNKEGELTKEYRE